MMEMEKEEKLKGMDTIFGQHPADSDSEINQVCLTDEK